MRHCRTLNNKINRIHEIALRNESIINHLSVRTVYFDYKSFFIIDKDDYFTIHQKVIQSLDAEI